MNYTFKEAKPIFISYFGLTDETANFIDNTNEHGLVIQKDNQKYVVFITSLGENTSSPKIYFDIRDSASEPFINTWNYANANNLKFFCLGIKHIKENFEEYIISLEADINTILNISGYEKGRRTKAGTQINVPTSLEPQGKISRVKSTSFSLSFAAVHKSFIFTYFEVFDNRLFEILNPQHEKTINNRNKILFGAPGTGKSKRLNDNSLSFLEQKEIKIDIKTQIKTEIEKAKEKRNKKALFISIGIKYANEIPNNYKDIEKLYGKNTYEIYVGIKTSKKLQEYQEKQKSTEGMDTESIYDYIKEEIKHISDTSTIEDNATALGFVFGNNLCDFTQNEINEKFGILNTESKGYWLLKGAQAFLCYEEPKQEKIKFVERITFHPNYSYSQFVGTYKPVQSSEDLDEIRYEFVPGVFLKTFVNAVKYTDRNFLLIIEEINRANVTSVFGDIFQLLDRNENGESEYPINASEDIKKYLLKNGINKSELCIPSNMYIWATMNSADQGVFPIDTAFKRRWEFEYIGINENSNIIQSCEIPILKKENEIINIKWNDLRVAINDKLIELGINEDKLLGPFFLNKHTLEEATTNENFIKLFESKVLMYLFEDAAKMKIRNLFKLDNKKYIYSELCKAFEEKGIEIFNFSPEVELETYTIPIEKTE